MTILLTTVNIWTKNKSMKKTITDEGAWHFFFTLLNTLCHDKLLQWFKSKGFADNKINVTE